jgi:serine/threonine protein kinase
MSPEQTGRVNRSIDYRTDFYSLGITFYELVCGHAPFLSNDPMELFHQHVACEPPPLPTRVPNVVQNIILKLLKYIFFIY